MWNVIIHMDICEVRKMNGFKKNKNGTNKRNQPNAANDQLGENASNAFKPEDYKNADNANKKNK
ncbi:MAG: hypothetical protein H7Y41_06220 [Hyphomonadaceae bacterium]|nr:hypothetical protein [Clostridia bacterium]